MVKIKLHSVPPPKKIDPAELRLSTEIAGRQLASRPGIPALIHAVQALTFLDVIFLLFESKIVNLKSTEPYMDQF
jgi:hypothetical protein